jgi:hypothetical protein
MGSSSTTSTESGSSLGGPSAGGNVAVVLLLEPLSAGAGTVRPRIPPRPSYRGSGVTGPSLVELLTRRALSCATRVTRSLDSARFRPGIPSATCAGVTSSNSTDFTSGGNSESSELAEPKLSFFSGIAPPRPVVGRDGRIRDTTGGGIAADVERAFRSRAVATSSGVASE